MLGALIGYLTTSQEDVRNIYKVGQHTVRLLMTAGDLLVGWLLLRQAEVALPTLAGRRRPRTRRSTRARSPSRRSSRRPSCRS